MTEKDTYSGEHGFQLTETRWHEKAWKFTRHLAREAPIFATVTISFWGVAEVLAQVAGETLELHQLAIPALVTALVVAAYKSFQKYRNYVPEALKDESATTQGIFRTGRVGWQFALTRQMLLERIATSDSSIDRVSTGAEFIAPKHLDVPEYLQWLSDRPEVLIRLLKAVCVQCTSELPNTLTAVRGEKRLEELRQAVSHLSHLYSKAAEYEIECHAVTPPEPLAGVHEIVHGWSEPIRKGVHEFLGILGSIANIDRRAVKAGDIPKLDFKIKFDAPENIPEFSSRMQAVDLTSLIANEM